MENWTEEIRVNQSQGGEFFSSCDRCSNSTRHRTLASVDVDAESKGSPIQFGGEVVYAEMWQKDHYQIVQCCGCDSISFRHSSTFSEYTTYDPIAEFEVPVERVYLYPRRVLKNKGLTDLTPLPEPVVQLYTETRSAFANEQPVLGGMGIRALVESVCKERNALGKNLEQRIDKLVELGHLSKDSSEFLHGLRIMGNESAHEGKRHTEDDLFRALEIVEHLLTAVYIIPVRAKTLPRRVGITNIDRER